MLVPTTCFNCESACGLLAYVDKETLQRAGSSRATPSIPGSRGRNCAKGPATLNQITDPDRILYPLKRAGQARRGQVGAGLVGTRRSTTSRRASARPSTEERHNEVMYHVGRPGEDGFTERILAAWGVDGHNSHTNVCSSSGARGLPVLDGSRPPESRPRERRTSSCSSARTSKRATTSTRTRSASSRRKREARSSSSSTRASRTRRRTPTSGSRPIPAREAAIVLSIANYLIQNDLYNREFVRRWWNWEEYHGGRAPGARDELRELRATCSRISTRATPSSIAAKESGVEARQLIEEIASVVATAGTRFSSHNWRSAAAGNSGGWQVARTLFLAQRAARRGGDRGRRLPERVEQVRAEADLHAAAPAALERADVAARVPARDERAVVPAPALPARTGAARLDVYFTRVYNPVWTNPDGFSWIEVLQDESLIGCYVALTPTWNETAYFADYILPMGHGSERHDIHSYETHDAQWLGFRQPVLRAARERMGETDQRHARGQPRRGLGRERVLARADVAHRPRRRARASASSSSRRSARASA